MSPITSSSSETEALGVRLGEAVNDTANTAGRQHVESPSPFDERKYQKPNRALAGSNILSELLGDMVQSMACRENEMAKQEKVRDNLEKDIDLVRENLHCLQRAIAGDSCALDLIRLRLLLEDARIAFRFAVVSYDFNYELGLPMVRDRVGHWWGKFRKKTMEMHHPGVSNDLNSVPHLNYEICRDTFLEHIQELRRIADRAQEEEERLVREARERYRQAKDDLDMVILMLGPDKRDQLFFHEVKEPNVTEKEEALEKAEIDMIFSEKWCMHAGNAHAAYDTAIKLLENERLFGYLEECGGGYGKVVQSEGDSSSRPFEGRYLLELVKQSGVMVLPKQTREEIVKLHNIVNPSFRSAGSITEVPGGPFGCNDSSGLLEGI